MPIAHQSPSEVIDISAWQSDIDFDPYPKGARAKNAIFSPPDGAPAFIIPDHRYLFKYSSHRYPEQYWIEIISYFIGCLMDVPVPPAFVALDSRNMQSGALIEWFYGFPKEHPVRYIEGGDFMVRMIPSYDREKGTQHNYRSVSKLTKTFADKGLLAQDGTEYWSKVLTFDALIGNTDRHQDNWGLIWQSSEDGKTRVTFAPAFDNGTSMGGEIIEKNFTKFDDPDYLLHYVNKGTHHMKWDSRDAARPSHADMLVRLITKHPDQRETMLKSLLFDLNKLKCLISNLTAFKVPVPLSEARVAFIIKLISFRREFLISILSE